MTKNNSNTIQAFWVAMGSVISYGFILLTSMVLSRYFLKGDYGTYRQVMYVYNTLLVVFTLGLPRAYSYFIPRVPIAQAKSLINKITYLFVALGVVFSFILFFGSPIIARFLNNDELEYALKIFSLVPLFMLPTLGLDGILSSFKQSKFIALYKSLSSFFQLICVAIPVVFFEGTYITAIVGFTISSFLIFVIALYLKNMPVRKQIKEKTDISYKQIFTFSLPLLYASLWGVLMNSADQYFISNYFGKEIFAEFSNGWMDLPFVSMIVGATSIVLLPVFSKIDHEGENSIEKIKTLWISTFEKTAKLIYPALLYSIVFSEVIMVVLYGDLYSNSGMYFRIKLFDNFFRMIAFAPLLLAIGATGYYAKVTAYGALSVIVLEYLMLHVIESPYTIAIVSLICHIGVIMFFIKYIARFLGTSIIKLFPIKLLFNIIAISLPLLLLLHYIFTSTINLNSLTILISSLIIYVPIFLIGSKMIGINYISIIKPFIKGTKK